MFLVECMKRSPFLQVKIFEDRGPCVRRIRPYDYVEYVSMSEDTLSLHNKVIGASDAKQSASQRRLNIVAFLRTDILRQRNWGVDRSLL